MQIPNYILDHLPSSYASIDYKMQQRNPQTPSEIEINMTIFQI